MKRTNALKFLIVMGLLSFWQTAGAKPEACPDLKHNCYYSDRNNVFNIELLGTFDDDYGSLKEERAVYLVTLRHVDGSTNINPASFRGEYSSYYPDGHSKDKYVVARCGWIGRSADSRFLSINRVDASEAEPWPHLTYKTRFLLTQVDGKVSGHVSKIKTHFLGSEPENENPWDRDRWPRELHTEILEKRPVTCSKMPVVE